MTRFFCQAFLFVKKSEEEKRKGINKWKTKTEISLTKIRKSLI